MLSVSLKLRLFNTPNAISVKSYLTAVSYSANITEGRKHKI